MLNTKIKWKEISFWSLETDPEWDQVWSKHPNPDAYIQENARFLSQLNDCKKIFIPYSLINIFGCEKSINDKSILKEIIEPPSSFTATSSDYQTNPIEPNSIIMGYLIDGYLPTDDQ